MDLAWHLARPDVEDDPEMRAAMYESLVKYINASGQWHLTIAEEMD